MSNDAEESASLVWQARITEYKSLRDEILRRIELRQQITYLTLSIAGVFFALGLSNANALALLVYPVLAFFLASSWYQNDANLRRIATYIRIEIESSVEGLDWETKLQEGRTKVDEHWRRTVFAHGGLFLLTQIVALVLGIILFVASPADELWLLFILLIVSDTLAIWGALGTFRRIRNPSQSVSLSD